MKKPSRKFRRHILANTPWWIVTKKRAFIDGEYGVVSSTYKREDRVRIDTRLVVSLWSLTSLIVGIIIGLLLSQIV